METYGLGGMSFFDAVGLRFHLPAYLSLAVNNDGRENAGNVLQSLLFHLTHLDGYNLYRFSILNDAQRRCVWEVLQHLSTEVDEPDLILAVECYWNPQHLPRENAGR